jgi:hypothetical protein
VVKVTYMDLPDCYRLSNATVELIVTTHVGPRVLHYGFINEENILGLCPDDAIKTELGVWKPWGGHRLWTAPEAIPRSYVPDNSPIEYELEGEYQIHLKQACETATGIQKEMTLRLDDEGAGVVINHRLTNRNLWTIEVAPWALTIMRGGGEAILPQEPFRSHDESLLPARPLVLWHYTNLSDPRFDIGQKYIRLRTEESRSEPQKIGIANKQGWAAYHHTRTFFIKRFNYQEHAAYPDYGSNNEAYTAGSFIEVESLAPIQRLEPGMSAEHLERWHLFRDVNLGESETSISESLTPLLEQLAKASPPVH